MGLCDYFYYQPLYFDAHSLIIFHQKNGFEKFVYFGLDPF